MGKKTVFTALFAALICAGCFIQIPLPGGVPIVIQDMMAMLSGLLLGPLYGSMSVLLFLVLGCLGLPVFSGKAGIQVILYGPTGGFLIGYLLAAFAGGLIMHFSRPAEPAAVQTDAYREKKLHRRNTAEWFRIIIAAVTAAAAVLTAGIIGFHRILPEKTLPQILAATLIPFIPGTIIKLLVIIPLTKKLRTSIRSYIE